MTKSGAGAQSLQTCKYYQNLQFLEDKIGKKIQKVIYLCLTINSLPNMRNIPQQPTTSSNSSSGAQQQILIQSGGTQQQISMSNTSSNTQQLDTSTASVVPSLVKRKNCSDASSGTKQKRLAREELSDRVDSLTLKYLDGMQSSEKEYNELLEKDDDPEMLFLKSLPESLKTLPKRKNRQAK